MNTWLRSTLVVAVTSLLCLRTVLCSSVDQVKWITYESPNGETLYLQDNRRPSLYTGNYGDCLGNSLVNVTRFDAAFYKDNMTVLFHLAGKTALQNESLVMYIGVYAYGENRFDLTFNPCHANIASLCPLNSSVPISANGIIPVAESEVSSIPSIALRIPDFEGQAILRIFANSTQSEIGCYSAVITNGHSFAHPKYAAIGLGTFTFVAAIASFATAAYGEAVPTMRLHYAHSLSVGVVFAVFQHIFFTGALSVNWPAVLVAWWHNFAWSGGMIYVESMQNSINLLIGNVVGNTSEVGAAPSNSGNVIVGGGYKIQQIYKRILIPGLQSRADPTFMRDLTPENPKDEYQSKLNAANDIQHHGAHALQARDYLANKTDGYRWYGRPVGLGMPLPGNYSGFSGTLAEENIRVSNAFTTGLLWFLTLLALLAAAVVALKWTIEILICFKAIKKDKLMFFRDHWFGYTMVVVLRTCYLGFFLLMFLPLFELSFHSSAGVKVLATIVFMIVLVGIPGASAYACHYKKYFVKDDPGNPTEYKNLLGFVPWAVTKEASAPGGNGLSQPKQAGNESKGKALWKMFIPFPKKLAIIPGKPDNIHDSEDYTMKFGWLVSRFRHTRWWFSSIWLLYDSLRAILYAGASDHPLAQVFGLLIVEIFAFVYLVWSRPFEGQRLNVIVVYCLGFSKVASIALSATFDVRFNLPRITTTVIGIAIVAIQGVLTIITLVAIVIGAISSYMSISRNCDDFHPRRWHGLREKYFDHLDRVVNDLPDESRPKKGTKRHSIEPAEPKTGFEIKSVKRMPKIQDEEAFASTFDTQDLGTSFTSFEDRLATTVDSSTTAVESQTSTPTTLAGRNRAVSFQDASRWNLPSGPRSRQPSWHTRDLRDLGHPSETHAAHRCTLTDRHLVEYEPVISSAAWEASGSGATSFGTTGI